jgi:hypothetical protein
VIVIKSDLDANGNLSMTDAKEAKIGSTANPTTVTLQADQSMLAGALLVCAASLAGGVLALQKNLILGLFLMLLFAIASVRTVLMMRENSTYLQLTPEDLTECVSGSKVFSVQWRNVRNIRIDWLGTEGISLKWNRRVFIDYVRDGHPMTFYIVPRTFGLSAEDLAAQMSTFRDAALGS